jgi:hypothetical protein
MHAAAGPDPLLADVVEQGELALAHVEDLVVLRVPVQWHGVARRDRVVGQKQRDALAVYPSNRMITVKVRAFVDHVACDLRARGFAP